MHFLFFALLLLIQAGSVQKIPKLLVVGAAAQSSAFFQSTPINFRNLIKHSETSSRLGGFESTRSKIQMLMIIYNGLKNSVPVDKVLETISKTNSDFKLEDLFSKDELESLFLRYKLSDNKQELLEELENNLNKI